MSSIEGIPTEVFINYLLPEIGVREVGSLTISCRILREICDSDEVWKVLYLRTIRAKITDTSIHIGPSWYRFRDYSGERALCKKLGISPGAWVTSPQYKQIFLVRDPVAPPGGLGGLHCNRWVTINTDGLLRCHPCLRSNENKDFVSTLKTWREVRDDGIDNDDFPREHGLDYGYTDNTQYLSYVENAWKDYNRKKGLSTVNLCQCTSCYDFTSLGFPDKCTNYKSFKKMTLKKEKTKVNKLAKKNSKLLRTRERQYEAAKRAFEIASAGRNDALREDKRISRLCDNLDNYTGVKKSKKVPTTDKPTVPSILIAHPKPERNHDTGAVLPIVPVQDY